ncbi:EmmdR/YeeO family multidrug/toxin efflux MATE transporter [Pseudolactococcus yaeyamensis]
MRLTQIKKVVTKRLQQDFSGQHFSTAALRQLFLPVLIDRTFLIMFGFINTALISASGSATIAAVNMVESLNVFLVSMISAIALAGTVLVARNFGAGRRIKVGKIMTTSILITFVIGVSFCLGMLLFKGSMLETIFGSAQADVMDIAQFYFLGVLLTYPSLAILEGINGVLRGISRTKSTLTISLFTNLLYLALSLILVIGLKQGILGLMIAMNFSRILGAIFALRLLLTSMKEDGFKLSRLTQINRQQVFSVIKTSIPFASEQLFFNGGKIIMQMIVVQLGTSAIAAHAIISTLAPMSEIIPIALSIIIIPIVGQSLGQKNPHDAKKITRVFLIYGSLMVYAMDLLVMIPAFPLLMRLFHVASDVQPIVRQTYWVIIIFHGLTFACSAILPAALKAAKDAVYSTTVSLVTMWGIRVILGYLLAKTCHLGVFGIWLAMAAEWLVKDVILYARFHRKKWQ